MAPPKQENGKITMLSLQNKKAAATICVAAAQLAGKLQVFF